MKLYKISVGVLLAGLLTTGCGDELLDKQPLDAVSDQTFWRTENDAVLAVTNCYRALSDADNRIFLSTATDDSYDWTTWPINMPPLGNGSATADVDAFNIFWTNLYRAIAAANNVTDNIDRIPSMNEDLRKRLLAEARFIRAYAYQQLAGLYGDVPLITKIQALNEFFPTRTPKAEVVDFIVQELDQIANDLPTSYGDADRGRVTKGAALALKARTLLYEGRYAQAAEAAKAVMDLGVYSIDPSYLSLFNGTNEGSAEIIWSEQRVQTNFPTGVATWVGGPAVGGWSQVVPLQGLVDTYECIDGQPINQSPLYNPAKPFENRDPRLTLTIVVPGGEVNGKVVDVTNATSPDRIGQNNASKSGYYYRKYIPATISGNWDNNSWNDIVLLRYAEVLLTYAEAKIEAGSIDQSVYDAINAVRGRADVKMPPIEANKSRAELREIVRRERHVEFPMEEHRLFDIRRWKIAEQVMNGTAYGILNNFDPSREDYGKHVVVEIRQFRPERDYVWPVPQSEMNVNKNLVQNPNW